MLARNKKGFTLVELVIVMTLVLVISTTFYTFFKSSLLGYVNLQKDATNLTGLAHESQRIATVVRGLTDITTAGDSELVMYAYFSPVDTYVSQIRYYLNAQETELFVDVTRMTANPPEGTPIASSKRTYTVIDQFRQTNEHNLFDYLDSVDTVLADPNANTNAIKAIQINLGTTTSGTTNQEISIKVNLRNKKANL